MSASAKRAAVVSSSRTTPVESGPAATGAQRLRVAQLIKSLGRGGAETLLREALVCPASREIEYSIGYFLPWKDALVEELEDLGASVTCFSAPSTARMFFSIHRVARWLRDIDADLVHCHLPLAGVVGRLAGKLAGVPVVYTEHNLQERYHRLTYWANKATWSLQDAVIAVSADVAGSIEANVGTEVPVRTIPNGVDVDRFAPDPALGAAVRSEWKIPPEAPVVGTVAVFRPQKRLDDWLGAAGLLAETHQDVYFLIVGDGPLRDELEELAAKSGLLDRVVFTGLQTDVRPFLAAMDVYMMSSIFEGLPIALLEAMAMGLPPVSTSVGGIGEVVDDGLSGFLTRPGDPSALARRASLLLADDQRRAAMSQAARRRVVDRHAIRRMSDDIQAIYRDVAGPGRKQRVPARDGARASTSRAAVTSSYPGSRHPDE